MSMSETEKTFLNYRYVIHLCVALFLCVNICLSIYQFVIHFHENQ